ncbi:MAG: D-mannonate dehydratase [Candidatus Omnitrophota bacterium]|nr:MAG: D-mannonate dehydratase [Candidatus Omnitrophota bacterium]
MQTIKTASSTQNSDIHPNPSDQGHPLTIPGYFGSHPGIQIGTQLPPNASDEDMQFTRQLGVEWVMTSLPPADHTLENYQALQRKFAAQGLKIYRLGNHSCHNMEEITLNLPGRDEKVEEYLRYIRLMGKAGIHYSTYAHMGNGIWSTKAEAIRGGAEARALRLDQNPVGYWADKKWREPLSHGRRYSEEELWVNYTYFIRKVAPVAEEAGVYIGIHPDDPPVYDLGGIPRCIFGTFAGYKRALEIADSPNIGVCLCVGCWLEGGPQMGKNVVEAICYFAEQKKLFKVHFRNVSEPLPKGFVETFLDDGYMNMCHVIRALHDAQYNGAVISDHIPHMIGGRHAAEAFAVGYIKALIQAATS